VLTLLGTREGIPIVGTVADGQASDQRLNANMLAALVEHFAPDQWQRLVYVADSALVTGPNLAALAARDLRLVSQLPETFNAAAAAKAAAWAADTWIPVGRIGVRQDAATYHAAEQTGAIDNRSYRLVVYRSSHLDRRKQKTLDRAVARAATALAQSAAALTAMAFACAADAEAAAATWRATATWHAVTTTVVPDTVVAKRPVRGAASGRRAASAPHDGVSGPGHRGGTRSRPNPSGARAGVHVRAPHQPPGGRR
jgi:transposase